MGVDLSWDGGAVSIQDVSWPWLAAITAVVLGFVKGVVSIWNIARAIERIEANGARCLIDITQLMDRVQQMEIDNSSAHAAVVTRLEDLERRMGTLEEVVRNLA